MPLMQGTIPETNATRSARSDDLRAALKGGSITQIGALASMGIEDFKALVESFGARFTHNIGRGVHFVVLGESGWPVTKGGLPLDALRKLRIGNKVEHWNTRIFTERQFLDALGMYEYRERVGGRYSLSTLSQLLGVPPRRIRSWVIAGLVAPAEVDHGVWYFDFRQVTAAKTILDLLGRSGVTLGRLRRSFELLRAWLPDVTTALHQVALLERDGELLLRLQSGELAAPDGQLRFEFRSPLDQAAEPTEVRTDQRQDTLRLVSAPRSPADWAQQGAEQEEAGFTQDAAESYRQALLLGGPDADICFSLANTLHAMGKFDQAGERFLQAVETRPDFTDAWNNLGICLAAVGQPEAACDAFRQALRVDESNVRAAWNLADTLDELGRRAEAEPYWRAYLNADPSSEWASHARRRLA